MASYKIYFLDFCYQNCSLVIEKWLTELQNATDKPGFTEKWFLRVKNGPGMGLIISATVFIIIPPFPCHNRGIPGDLKPEPRK